MRAAVILNRDELAKLQTAIVVEMWSRVGSKDGYGKQRRAYLAEFNEDERKKIGELHRLFYDWHLRTGLPEEKSFSIETVFFIRRVVNFFATV